MRNRPRLKVCPDSSRVARFRILMLLSDHLFRLVSTRRWYVLDSAEASASRFPGSVYRWFCMIYCMEARKPRPVCCIRVTHVTAHIQTTSATCNINIACISSGGHHNNLMVLCLTSPFVKSLVQLTLSSILCHWSDLSISMDIQLRERFTAKINVCI